MSDEELDRVIEESRAMARSPSGFSRVPAEELDSESEAAAPMVWDPSAAAEAGSMPDDDLERPIRRISNEELERILAECREVMQQHEAYWRVQRDVPDGQLERMPPMVSTPSLPTRSETVARSEAAPSAPVARPQRAALLVGAQLGAIVLRAMGALWLAAVFAVVAWSGIEQMRAVPGARAVVEWLQEARSPLGLHHLLAAAALTLPGIACLEVAKRMSRAR